MPTFRGDTNERCPPGTAHGAAAIAGLENCARRPTGLWLLRSWRGVALGPPGIRRERRPWVGPLGVVLDPRVELIRDLADADVSTGGAPLVPEVLDSLRGRGGAVDDAGPRFLGHRVLRHVVSSGFERLGVLIGQPEVDPGDGRVLVFLWHFAHLARPEV